jgi:hypothetical protein
MFIPLACARMFGRFAFYSVLETLVLLRGYPVDMNILDPDTGTHNSGLMKSKSNFLDEESMHFD